MTDRLQIPVSAAEINEHCGSCVGACCRAGVILTLSDGEKQFMDGRGAQLADTGLNTRAQDVEQTMKLLRDRLGDDLAEMYADSILSVSPEHPSYLLTEDCPNLVELEVGGVAVCSVWEDPDRPAVCDRFEAGNPRCNDARDAYRQNTATTPTA